MGRSSIYLDTRVMLCKSHTPYGVLPTWPALVLLKGIFDQSSNAARKLLRNPHHFGWPLRAQINVQCYYQNATGISTKHCWSRYHSLSTNEAWDINTLEISSVLPSTRSRQPDLPRHQPLAHPHSLPNTVCRSLVNKPIIVTKYTFNHSPKCPE